MAEFFKRVLNILFGSFDENSLLQGASDIVMVRWDSGKVRSCPYIINFGIQTALSRNRQVKMYVNDQPLKNFVFNLDKYGYIHPMYPSAQLLKHIVSLLPANQNRHKITFQLQNKHKISCEMYVYSQHDKIVVSDVDGTLTKSDLVGLHHNIHGWHYLHEGYYELIEALDKNQVKIMWLTMRSLSLYNFSKQYIQKHTRINGPLLTEPEQLLTAVKKQVAKKTVEVKASLLKNIRKLFPQHRNPFIGGLGNRENDAKAYKQVGIPLEGIFIVDTESSVHHYLGIDRKITYHEMSKDVELYFPKGQQQQKLAKTQSCENPSQSFKTPIKIVHKQTFS